MTRRLLLMAAGAAAAVLVRRVYLASVAFPRAVRQAGADMVEQIEAVRRYADTLEALGLPRDKAGPALAAHFDSIRAHPRRPR